MNSSASPVPDDLMQQLHDASANFHELVVEWEKALASVEYRHAERVETAWQQIRQAQRNLETLDAKIKRLMTGTNGTPAELH